MSGGKARLLQLDSLSLSVKTMGMGKRSPEGKSDGGEDKAFVRAEEFLERTNEKRDVLSTCFKIHAN